MSFLDTAFPDLGTDQFLKECLNKRAHVSHGPLERFGEFGNLDAADAMTMLSRLDHDRFSAYFKIRSDVNKHVQVKKELASTLLEAGHTVVVEFADEAFPAVSKWLLGLRRDLSSSPKKGIAAVVLSPAGNAAAMHFDQYNVVILQLRGRKRWWVARNTDVEHPIHEYFPESNTGRNPEVWQPKYFPNSLPTQMPEDSESFVLEPGSAAIVPPGWWHRTEALEYSISVTLGVQVPPGMQLVLSALERRLERSPAWRRRVALALDGRKAAADVDDLLTLLKREVAELTADEVLAVFSAPRLQLRAGFSASIVEVNSRKSLEITRNGERAHSLPLVNRVTSVLAEALSQGRSISRGELVTRSEMDERAVDATIGVIRKLDFLSEDTAAAS